MAPYTGFVADVRRPSISLVIHSMSFPSWLGQDLSYVCGVLTSSLEYILTQ